MNEKKTLVRVSLDDKVLAKAKKVFAQNGLSTTDAITLFYERIILDPYFPVSLK